MDLTVALDKRVQPWIEKHPLGTRGKLVAGATMGALILGPVGMVFGLKGVAVTSALGAVGGAVQTWRFLKSRERSATPEPPPLDPRIGAPLELLKGPRPPQVGRPA